MRAASARSALENSFGTRTGSFGRGFEAEFMQTHVNAPAAKGDAFVLEPQPLLHRGRAAQFDVTARAHHAVPGYRPVRRSQGPRHLSRVPRITGGAGHTSVRGNFAFRNFPDGTEQIAEHALYEPGAAARTSGPTMVNFSKLRRKRAARSAAARS